MITFTVEGKPVPWSRAGRNGKQTFTPAKVRQYQDWIKLKAVQAMQGQAPLEGPLRLEMLALFDIPPSWTKKRKAAAEWHTSKPDSDNLQKVLKDSCNQIVWRDDAQVCVTSAVKRYVREGEAPGLVVTVEGV